MKKLQNKRKQLKEPKVKADHDKDDNVVDAEFEEVKDDK